MVVEQREVLDEIIAKIRAGRITRRTFLERAVTVGLSSASAVSLLEACGGTSNSTGGNGNTVMISWQNNHDASGYVQNIVADFNKQNNGIHVTYTNGPSDTGQLLTVFTTMLRARSHTFDVMAMDIIWPPEFGANGWTVPLDDKWPASERQNYFQGPIQGCTYNGKLWAAPMTTEPGMLYYRTDLVSTPPNTWEDLFNTAKSVASSKVKYGYLWQGAQYEGLVCDFVEVLYGYGGSVLDANDSKKVTINSPEGVQALTQMVNWVGTISPSAVTTYKEEEARSAWQDGDSAFMRNWAYAYGLGNDPKTSKIAKKFDVHTIPYSGGGTVGHSCIGGWQLGINAFSTNPDASWKFIHYMLSAPVQKQLVLKTSTFSTLQSISTDPDVVAVLPFMSKVRAMLEGGKSRPVTPFYPDVTNAIQVQVHQALTKQISPAAALKDLENNLQAIVSK